MARSSMRGDKGKTAKGSRTGDGARNLPKPKMGMGGKHQVGSLHHSASGTFHGKKGSVKSRSNYAFPVGLPQTNRAIHVKSSGLSGGEGE